MLTTQQIALWADKLRDISATGLRFSNNIYDRDNYQTIQDIARVMLAAASNEPIKAMEPLRGLVFSRPTPVAVGGAAVINEQGEILLIRQADNQKWAMPAGALEVGETPAEGVVRETLEETGVICETISLVGVFDSRLLRVPAHHHSYRFTFLCRPVSSQTASGASHAHEVIDVQWFAEDALPQELKPGQKLRITEAYRMWRGDTGAFFDR